ncbi:hydantoinase/oxoprolinase family protein [Rhodococcus koreensis]
MTYQISADTGGTFIDVVVSDERGRKTIGKSLTTHHRVFEGLSKAIANAAEELGLNATTLLDDTDLFLYGTTRATNAIVTRNIAKTAFLTTAGFPDILVLKEGGKLDGHDFAKDYPDPYIPRRHTFEIPERITSEGQVSAPLDEDAVRGLLENLADNGFEAVAVSLLWSVVNPAHELRIAELIEQILPGVPYTLSHRIAPIIREYRRASATVIDASLKPLMQQHFRELETDLRDFGYRGKLLVSTSVGGVMTIDEVIAAPIHTAKSGPAMAPLAGLTYSQLEGLGGDMIVCDTGGTTFDVGLSRGGELVYSRDTWLGGLWEGDLLGISSVDIRSIGAGGGSIAWVDDGGLLRVGPQSAGSDPGPACYGLGGTEPTLSDAACVLGYFDPAYFLGGRMKLDADAATTAIERLAAQLGLGVRETAWGILTLASDSMVKAVHEITISQGLNPQESTVVAGGGAAGINIMQIAAELGSTNVVLPRVASALSASGMHFADIVKEESSAHITSSNRFDVTGVNEVLATLEARLEDFLTRVGMADHPHEIVFLAEARYQSQVWELDTPLGLRRFASDADVDQFVATFHDVHEDLFAVRDEGSAVEAINWKARLTVPLPHENEQTATPGNGDTAEPATRPCFFGGTDTVDTRIYNPTQLATGAIVEGPAIIEEPTTTLVVFPGMAAEVSATGNYILHVHGKRA